MDEGLREKSEEGRDRREASRRLSSLPAEQIPFRRDTLELVDSSVWCSKSAHKGEALEEKERKGGGDEMDRRRRARPFFDFSLPFLSSLTSSSSSFLPPLPQFVPVPPSPLPSPPTRGHTPLYISSTKPELLY